MTRMVKVTIVYDMDDEGKDIALELKDWMDGNVTIADVLDCDGKVDIIEL